MVRKWEGEIKTENGSIDLGIEAQTTTARSKLRPNSVNPETGNRARQKVVDEDTGEELGSWNNCGKKVEIGDQEAVFDAGVFTEIKKTVITDGFDVQKVVDEEDFDKARIKKEAYNVTPQDDQETKYQLLRSGLNQTGKVLIVKYAPSTSENLYGIWADDRGLWISEIAYPDNFEYEEIEEPDLSSEYREKAKNLILKAEEKYEDTEIVDNQREKLEEAIEKKMNGEELDVQAEQEKAEEQELEDELEAVL